MLVVLMFMVGAGAVLGAYALFVHLPGALERRRMQQRLDDLSGPIDKPLDEASVVLQDEGQIAFLDRAVSGTAAGSWLAKLIERSGTRTSPGMVIVMSIVTGLIGAFLAAMILTNLTFAAPIVLFAGLAFSTAPILLLKRKATVRLRKFEEQFPEALELLARALRAGHAFQTALGMAADELREPGGPEFKKTFDQQNFGLPLRDALLQMIERVPLLDVRFFVTAVMIQRESGGNLSEILENLAHVVRERFKILRQVRVHTAHGRFTAFVLLALPGSLGITLYLINPEHMEVLFKESMGQTMLMITVVMQVIGFFWIQKVIKIEV